VADAAEPVRLNRYLAQCGVASRRGADALIAAGRVQVDGAIAEPGLVVRAGQEVRVDGEAVAPEVATVVMLNKPIGVVTTASDPQARPTVIDLVDLPQRVVPVGRLDVDTTGLLLLTNDGDLAQRLAHPSHGVPKTYRALVRGVPGPAALRRLRRGVELEDGRTAPADVEVVGHGSGGAELQIVLKEGRNRQVRRMCAAVGYPVIELHRIAYGPLTLGRLGEGHFRTLREAELRELRGAV
jgi:23S rRNA pseudouridine2605 synthase